MYILYRKSPLKEDNLSIKDKMAGPECVLIKKFHCSVSMTTPIYFQVVVPVLTIIQSDSVL